MTLNLTIFRLLALAMVLIFMVGCRASGNRRAPIEERSGSDRHNLVADREMPGKNINDSAKRYVQRAQDARVQVYVVQKGDTLYSIAFENGLDYREVAEQNNIDNPAAIQIGQKIKLFPSEDNINDRSYVETKALSTGASAQAVKKDYPQIFKLPYSDQAVNQVEKMQQEFDQTSVTKVTPRTVFAPPIVLLPPHVVDAGGDDGVDWSMPTKGKIIGEYSENANRKGIDIAGTRGQAVVASAAGKVVYSGSGLRGYGKLVIIKHNKTFLSAYAHNEQILVKEGQSVLKGQKIAEMGSSDADQIKLHFEIRQFGKPVDPAKFLNLGKS